MIRPLCPYRKPNNNNETPVTPCKRIKLTPLRDINTQPRMHFVSTLENANPQQQAPKTKSAPKAQVGPIHLRASNPGPLKRLRTNLSTTTEYQILPRRQAPRHPLSSLPDAISTGNSSTSPKYASIPLRPIHQNNVSIQEPCSRDVNARQPKLFSSGVIDQTRLNKIHHPNSTSVRLK